MHLPHTNETQAAFYASVEKDLRRAYATLPLDDADFSAEGRIPTNREVIWAADHNFVLDTKRDAMPAHSSPNHPQAREARLNMRTYLKGTQDVYRTLQPEGRAITRTTPDHGHRIDTVEVTPGLMSQEGQFVKCQHTQPQMRIVFQSGSARNGRKAKISDHHYLSLTYRTCNIPQRNRSKHNLKRAFVVSRLTSLPALWWCRARFD